MHKISISVTWHLNRRHLKTHFFPCIISLQICHVLVSLVSCRGNQVYQMSKWFYSGSWWYLDSSTFTLPHLAIYLSNNLFFNCNFLLWHNRLTNKLWDFSYYLYSDFQICTETHTHTTNVPHPEPFESKLLILCPFTHK